MPKYIIKLTDENTQKDYYLEWSTIVDAPVTYGMTVDEFKEYYKEYNGLNGMSELEARLERAEKNGTSGYPPFDNLNDLIKNNHAGDTGNELSKIEIIENYCINHN